MISTGKIIKLALESCRISLSSSQCRTVAAIAGSQRLAVNSPSAQLHTTAAQTAGQDWRKARGMPANPTSYGPLADGPDYSYLDGRVTPPSMGKIKRAQVQKEIAEKILTMTAEVDFAVSRHARMQKEAAEEKASKIASKLKPKGQVPPEVKSR